jgi:TetR/AcrR family transcriptional repressor of nem operon
MITFFQTLIQFILDTEHPSGCFYTNTATAIGTLNEEVLTVIKLGSEKLEHDFYTFFLRGQQRGEIGMDKDLHALASYFVGLVRGVSVMARIQTSRKTLADIVEVGIKSLD